MPIVRAPAYPQETHNGHWDAFAERIYGMSSLVTALLAGFGRAAAEVGAVLIVGGNIDGFTRTMTTAIALRGLERRPATRHLWASC